MNYIKQLQQDNRIYANQINQADHAINNFRVFLNSDKFKGVDLDGSRKDWISVDDVRRELELIRAELLKLHR